MPANTVYRSGDEIATETLKAIATALHAVRDQKLLPALGDDIAAARPALLPLQRSALTARLIGAQLRALEDWYAAAYRVPRCPLNQRGWIARCGMS